MFLSLKNIPKVSWSSEKPLNLRPRISTFLFLCLGLTLFGLGEGLLLVSLTGASPWTVFAEGISLNVDFSIGTVTLFVSLAVLFFWIFLDQKPGIGTLLNAIIIAVMIDVSLAFLPPPANYISQLFLSIFWRFSRHSKPEKGPIETQKGRKPFPGLLTVKKKYFSVKQI